MTNDFIRNLDDTVKLIHYGTVCCKIRQHVNSVTELVDLVRKTFLPDHFVTSNFPTAVRDDSVEFSQQALLPLLAQRQDE